jgi:hypothetical protein
VGLGLRRRRQTLTENYEVVVVVVNSVVDGLFGLKYIGLLRTFAIGLTARLAVKALQAPAVHQQKDERKSEGLSIPLRPFGA